MNNLNQNSVKEIKVNLFDKKEAIFYTDRDSLKAVNKIIKFVHEHYENFEEYSKFFKMANIGKFVTFGNPKNISKENFNKLIN